MLVHGNAKEGVENVAEIFELGGGIVCERGVERRGGAGSMVVMPKRFGLDSDVVILAYS